MADSSDVDQSLVDRLQHDAQLQALCPDGVHVDEAPPGSTRFVIVSLVDEVDVPVLTGRAIEDALYLVEARMLSIDDDNVHAAARRIDALLEREPLDAQGYGGMANNREDRVARTEHDDVDRSIRWARAGGHYRVQMSVRRGAALPIGSPWIAPGWVAPGWAA